MTSSSRLRNVFLFALVLMPSLAGGLAADSPRAYYIGQATLVSVLLFREWRGSDWERRAVLALGILIQVMSGACAMLLESGSVPYALMWILLFAVVVVAEVLSKRSEPTEAEIEGKHDVR